MDDINSQVLAAPMRQPNDAGAATVRDYLKALLAKVITEEEEFSGKRPFGNSGWVYDLERALVQAGLASGEISGDGCLDGEDTDQCQALILAAIQSL